MQLCIAFDLDSKAKCLSLAKELCGLKPWIKIGMRSFYRDGFALIDELKQLGDFKIFLDLKLYDIPNTMQEAIMELAAFEIDMINIHASAGFEAMNLVAKSLKTREKSPLLLAVSALTSFDEQGFYDIYKQGLQESVINMSKLAFEAGLDGMVCSVHESSMIKAATSSSFLTLCPGIRDISEERSDQKRTASVSSAFEAGADFIVVGRPIIRDKNPYNKSMKILEQIASFKL